jgi:hypothetical protein
MLQRGSNCLTSSKLENAHFDYYDPQFELSCSRNTPSAMRWGVSKALMFAATSDRRAIVAVLLDYTN